MSTLEARTAPLAPAFGDDRDVKVLFIVGWDRSGSTILDLVLGGITGFLAVGELQHLWDRGILERRLCGCGSPVVDCAHWSAILERVYGRMPDVADARSVVATRSRELRVRSTWRITHTRGRGLEMYLSLMRKVYGAIAAGTGARVIVDASKDPPFAAVLSLLPGVRPYFVHLVRDPRATAFSMSRRPKIQTDTSDSRRMTRESVARSTRNWLLWNVAAEHVRRTVPQEKWLLLRYEDFVARPAASVRQIARFVGEDSAATPFVDDSTADLAVNHTVSGNPSRFASGRVTISNDAEWIRDQPPADRLIATAIALPLLHRYGYRLSVRQRQA
jgi:hypothetical protein